MTFGEGGFWKPGTPPKSAPGSSKFIDVTVKYITRTITKNTWKVT